MWNSGNTWQALEDLGRGLHAVQDIEAHMNWGDNAMAIGVHHDSTEPWHKVSGFNFDNPGIDYSEESIQGRTYVPHAGNRRCMKSVAATRAYLQQFIDATGGLSLPVKPRTYEWVVYDDGTQGYEPQW